MMAMTLSERKLGLDHNIIERTRTLLRNYSLPTHCDCDHEALCDALLKDKKRKGECVDFVLLEEAGKAVVVPISFAELHEVIVHLHCYCEE